MGFSKNKSYDRKTQTNTHTQQIFIPFYIVFDFAYKIYSSTYLEKIIVKYNRLIKIKQLFSTFSRKWENALSEYRVAA